jgi:virginiamycin B lyase
VRFTFHPPVAGVHTMQSHSKLVIGRANFRFAAVLLSLGVLAGCGAAGTAVPVQPAVPAQPARAAGQSVALRPLQFGSSPHQLGRLAFQPEQMHEFTANVTPVTTQLSPQAVRRTASVGWASNTITAANSNNLGITSGPDGRLWFCENGGTNGKIAALSTSGVLSEYTIPSVVFGGSTYTFHPLSITPAAGKLWFSSGGAIGSFSTSGVFQGWFYMTSGTQITYEAFSTLVTGPDNNLWTLDYGNPNKLWRITTGGSFASAPLPTSNALQTSSPGLISGADGNLYFTEYGRNAVMEYSLSSGFIAEYTLTLTNSHPIGITNGPDGQVWFTEASTVSGGTGYLLYVTASGVSGYSISTNPGSITTSRGALWYISPGLMSQFTPGGTTIYNYTLPAGSATGVGMTTGPDLNLWFTGGGSGGNVVTKFSTL